MRLPSVTSEPWNRLSFGVRWALQTITAMLWPLESDQRITILMNLLAAELRNGVDEGEIDVVIEILRHELKRR
jgi:hypothetical protein